MTAALAAIAIVVTACGQAALPAARSSSPAGFDKDFKIVAYQGDPLLGGHETTFAGVFAQGKPVVLNFWAGNCPPCRAEMPGFQTVSEQFKGKVIFVGIDVGPFLGLGTHEDAQRLYKQLGIRYPLAYAVDPSPLRLFTVRGMPTTVFLTASGRIVDEATGILTEDSLRDRIRNLLAAS